MKVPIVFTGALLALGGAAAGQDYVGDGMCSLCHADHPTTGFFDAYMKSGHPWKVSFTGGETPAPDFWPFTPLPMLPVVEGTQLAWPDIEYVIGNYFWKARYIQPDGYIYTGTGEDKTQWNLATQEFVPYHVDELKPFNCGRCHTTGYDPAGNQNGLPGLVGTWTEEGIRCEACHGPSGDHVDSFGLTPPPGGKDCSECHYRDSEFRMPWKSGFMRHHQQSEDLSHSPHLMYECTACHNPHRSTVYQDGGMNNDCSNCHPGNDANAFYKVAGMDLLECTDCHMPFMAKSATASSTYRADVRGHLFRIMTDPVFAADNVTDVGGSLFWNQDGMGQASVTLDYACLGCHEEINSPLTMQEASDFAINIHTEHPATFQTSLHATRAGKNTWYGTENGGFEEYTNVPIEDIGCTGCHGPTDADGNAYDDETYAPSCVDCHATSDFSVSESQCFGCHGRQKSEINVLGLTDVHRDAGFTCMSCHNENEMHGDGTAYVSMFDPGAVTTDCEGCHNEDGIPVPGSHAFLDPHDGKLHCSACHVQSVLSCYNCHFESQVESHVKRAYRPIGDFVMLVNREKDGKVYPASFQSLTYQGSKFIALGPYSAHSVTDAGRVCSDCHANSPHFGDIEAIDQYNQTGEIRFSEWDEPTTTLTWMNGIIPIPEDYQTSLKMEFLTYTGDTSDPPGPSPLWTGLDEEPDRIQMLYATPLSQDQMTSLGFEFAAPCKGDTNGDDLLNIDDIVNAVICFGQNGVDDCAGPGTTGDIDDGSGTGTQDGLNNIDDIVYAVLRFGASCP